MTLARYNVIRWLWARPRLIMSTVVSVGLFLLLPQDWRATTRGLVAWDCGAIIYLAAVIRMMARADIAQLRRNADAQDEGAAFILVLLTVAAVCSIVAIVAQLSNAKHLHGVELLQQAGLAGGTVFLSWCFIHTIYALHYAHEYYADGADDTCGGLDFPGTTEPDYWDFMYFSFILGTSAQTADVAITSRAIRHTAIIHCVLAFFFNTSILALSINLGASLLSD